MQLKPGDRLTDSTGEWEVVGRPYATAGGKSTQALLWSDSLGMGTATAQAQNLADQLAIPLERVRFEYGDSRLPEAPVAGGSSTTISVGASVIAACDAMKRKIHDQIVEDARSPLFGTRFEDIVFRDGGIYHRDDPARGETFTAILRRFGKGMFDARGQAARDEEHRNDLTATVSTTAALRPGSSSGPNLRRAKSGGCQSNRGRDGPPRPVRPFASPYICGLTARGGRLYGSRISGVGTRVKLA